MPSENALHQHSSLTPTRPEFEILKKRKNFFIQNWLFKPLAKSILIQILPKNINDIFLMLIVFCRSLETNFLKFSRTFLR